ncbi:MAG: hypothetical protein OXI63_26520 [Candidatus Poribacteria bacterium]|nr:hypothetical protein [Candidatus Poribacteria bacterium]
MECYLTLITILSLITIYSPIYAQHPDAVGIWLFDELQTLSVARAIDDIKRDMNDGIQLAVEANGKTTTTWSRLRTRW